MGSERVEQMVKEIAAKHGIQPPDQRVKQELDALGEDRALSILIKVSKVSVPIRNLSAYIKWAIKNLNDPSTISSPQSQSQSYSSSAIATGHDNDNEVTSISIPNDGWEDESSCSTSMPTSRNCISKNCERQPSSEKAMALDNIAFPKAFMALAYLGQDDLDELLSLNEINSLKMLSMGAVEQLLRKKQRKKCGSNFQLDKKVLENEFWKDWNPDEDKDYDKNPNIFLEYHCYVDVNGKYTFKGPFVEQGKTHLHRVYGDSNVLRVHFAEELHDTKLYTPSNLEKEKFHWLAQNGIYIGRRKYLFFVYKEIDKREKKVSKNKRNPIVSTKCYFVCITSFSIANKNMSRGMSRNPVQEARCQFMHIHNVATLPKYMARFSLILSKTTPLDYDLSDVTVRFEKDIECIDENGNAARDINGEVMIHTDGTGFISEDLAEKIQRSKNPSCEVLPLLSQIRLFYKGFAIKGTLLLNKKLPDNTIVIRSSMVKVERDENYVGLPAIDSLEICNIGQKHEAYLSQTLIALLNYGGVPDSFFKALTWRALEDLSIKCRDEEKAWKLLKQNQRLDDDYTVLRMLSAGIPVNEPFLQQRLGEYLTNDIKNIRKGKVRLDNSYYVMGTADPSGRLKPNEVCIILDHGQVSGDVLVYRNPGRHFGDVHLYKATYVKEIEEIVGDAKFGIFFSTQGKRSGADEIAGGDFDGDLYWVCVNKTVLKDYKLQPSWPRPKIEEEPPLPKPTDFFSEDLEQCLFDQFLTCRFSPSSTTGSAANSWMAYMDRLLTPIVAESKEADLLTEKMLLLVEIYYKALDASKTGSKVELPNELRAQKMPHCMNDDSDCNLDDYYMSTSLLGELYDLKLDSNSDDIDEKAKKTGDIVMLPDFLEETNKKTLWMKHYEIYRSEMSNAMDSPDSSRANDIYLKYKKILCKADCLDESSKNRSDIYDEARAIYQVVYDYAQSIGDVRKCRFAWFVAGEALCEIYFKKHHKNPILISASKLYSIL